MNFKKIEISEKHLKKNKKKNYEFHSFVKKITNTSGELISRLSLSLFVV